jgi:hypothetical protein
MYVGQSGNTTSKRVWLSELASNDNQAPAGESRACGPDFRKQKKTGKRRMSASNPSPATMSWTLQQRLQEYARAMKLAEIIYQDPNGQVCVVHGVIRDVLSRAGRDFVVLGKGQVVSADHIIMIDGERLTKG